MFTGQRGSLISMQLPPLEPLYTPSPKSRHRLDYQPHSQGRYSDPGHWAPHFPGMKAETGRPGEEHGDPRISPATHDSWPCASCCHCTTSVEVILKACAHRLSDSLTGGNPRIDRFECVQLQARPPGTVTRAAGQSSMVGLGGTTGVRNSPPEVSQLDLSPLQNLGRLQPLLSFPYFQLNCNRTLCQRMTRTDCKSSMWLSLSSMDKINALQAQQANIIVV